MDFGDQIHRALALLRARPRCWPRCASATATCWSTSSRTPTTRSSSWCGCWPATDPARTSPWWATTTRPSTAGAARPRPTCSRSGGSTRARARWCCSENHRSTQPILDAAARLISYNNPYRLEVVAGIDKRLRSPRGGRPAGAPPALRHRLGRGRRGGGAHRGAAAAGLPPARPRHPGAQQRRRRPVPARAQRQGHPAPLQRQPRALRARGGAPARRVPARAGQPRRLGVRLLPGRLRALPLPEPDLLRLNHYARRKTPAAARGAARRCPTNEELGRRSGGGGRARRRARLLADLDRAAADVAAPAHGRGAVPVPAVRRACWRGSSREASARGRGAGQEHRALLRDRDAPTATWPSTTACPRSSRTSTCCARPATTPRWPRPSRDDDAVHVAHRAQGQGPRVPAWCSWWAAPRSASPCGARRERAGAAGRAGRRGGRAAATRTCRRSGASSTWP